jgi:translation initiation factor 1
MRSKPRKQRIATDSQPSPLGGFGNAFADLDLPDDLPPGPEAEAPAPSGPSTRKFGRVVLRREKAHRGGRTVIVVHDFASHLPDSVIDSVARKLRAACGCGGTVRDRTVEIQGDQAGRIREALEAEGFRVAGVS